MSVLKLTTTERILVAMQPGQWYCQKQLAELGNCKLNSISSRMFAPEKNGLVVIDRNARPMRIRLAGGVSQAAPAVAQVAPDAAVKKPINSPMLREAIERAAKFLREHGYRVTPP